MENNKLKLQKEFNKILNPLIEYLNTENEKENKLKVLIVLKDYTKSKIKDLKGGLR